MSQKLRVSCRTRMVKQRNEGRVVHYSLADDPVRTILHVVPTTYVKEVTGDGHGESTVATSTSE